MSARPNLATVLSFLSSLKRHNNRDWFEAHRADYDAARAEFEGFVAELILELCEIERLDGVKPKECIRRIYRDIRFSANKTPYKTHMAAEIAAGGTKATKLPYYIHLAPKNGSIIAGGLYSPSTADLIRFRQAIAHDAKPFKRIVGAPAFKRHYGVLDGDRLKTAPKGFAREHPDIDLLRLTEIVAWEEVPDAAVTRPGFAKYVVTAFVAMKPFLDYLNHTTGRAGLNIRA